MGVQQPNGPKAEALGDALAPHLSSLRCFVRLRAGRILEHESCSDIVQSVCREAVRDIGALRKRSDPSFRAWLYALTLSKIRNKVDYYRAQKRDIARRTTMGEDGDDAAMPALCARMDSPSEAAIASERLAAIDEAIQCLPEEPRNALLLSVVAGLSNDEIAKCLGKKPNTISQIIVRAKARLAMMLHK